MSQQDTPISTDELQAWVDRQTDAEASARIATIVAQDAVLAARASAWASQRNALHAAFDATLDEPIPQRLLDAARPPRPRWPLQLAAALACVALGGVLGYALPRPAATPAAGDPLAGLPRAAAIAHAVYVPEVRHPVEVGAEQQTHLVAWLSKRLGSPLTVPELGASGFMLVGGRLLPGSEGGAVAQFMYQNEAGQRLTLYVRHNAASPETAFRFAAEKELSVFYWVDGGMGYALSAKLPREALLQIAELVYRQLQRGGAPG
ncbi:anti-sigma factor [Niveibacterium sp.]|uniref:anti-sigma factor family protein n=1 Tax=Niveibacterium sp. TaxID=2017444 RepID=UPI0035B3E4CF